MLEHSQRTARIVSNLESVHEETSFGVSWKEALVDAPSFDGGVTVPSTKNRFPRKLDLAEVNDRNSRLGRDGEEFVLEYERSRLSDSGRLDLAGSVIWTSDVPGDGTGCDIASYDLDGS